MMTRVMCDTKYGNTQKKQIMSRATVILPLDPGLKNGNIIVRKCVSNLHPNCDKKYLTVSILIGRRYYSWPGIFGVLFSNFQKIKMLYLDYIPNDLEYQNKCYLFLCRLGNKCKYL